MVHRNCRAALLAILVACGATPFVRTTPAAAQGMVGVTLPGQRFGGGYDEQIGIGWGIRQVGPQGGFFFRNGAPAPPPFGLAPGNPASLNLGGRGGGFEWNLGITASQGSSRSLSVQAPSIMLPNGGMGYFANTVQTPFVTGLVPVVGDYWISPVQVRWQQLQYERARARIQSESVDSEAGAPLPPPPAAPRHAAEKPVELRRHDDPPLIMRGP